MSVDVTCGRLVHRQESILLLVGEHSSPNRCWQIAIGAPSAAGELLLIGDVYADLGS